MNIPLDQRIRWRAFAELAHNTAINARLCYGRGSFPQGREILAALESQAAAVGVSMEQAGADRPGFLPPPPDGPLQLLDKPANRRYLNTAHRGALLVGGQHLVAEGRGVAPVGLGLLEGAPAVAAVEALHGALAAPVFDDVVALAVAAQDDLDDHEPSLPKPVL